MRAFRAAATVLLSAVVLGGCGPGGPDGSAGPPARPDDGGGGTTTTATATATATVSPEPTPTANPAPTASPSPAVPPAAVGEILVRVSRSGGFVGGTHTLRVKGDGSWTRLDRRAEPEGTGRLAPAELAALRTALREADFARLPRTVLGDSTIHDGFTYAFVHGGHEVVTETGSVPAALERVLVALPPFEPDRTSS
ncbi:hypothetical protein ABZX75_20405 [Streptomyces sp. NPDC003038]|uniref:hypothetical protein n=1 Tax=unclassified Streptomyces TaxID=2593676 RepID=UPI00339F2870